LTLSPVDSVALTRIPAQMFLKMPIFCTAVARKNTG